MRSLKIIIPLTLFLVCMTYVFNVYGHEISKKKKKPKVSNGPQGNPGDLGPTGPTGSKGAPGEIEKHYEKQSCYDIHYFSAYNSLDAPTICNGDIVFTEAPDIFGNAISAVSSTTISLNEVGAYYVSFDCLTDERSFSSTIQIFINDTPILPACQMGIPGSNFSLQSVVRISKAPSFLKIGTTNLIGIKLATGNSARLTILKINAKGA